MDTKNCAKCVVPIENKIALTIPEAAELSNIGQNRIEKLLPGAQLSVCAFCGGKEAG